MSGERGPVTSMPDVLYPLCRMSTESPLSPQIYITLPSPELCPIFGCGRGTAVAQWLRCCVTNRKVAGSIPAGVIDIKSFRSHYGPGVDSASNRNEYREYFLGGKGGRCVRLTTYHHPVPLSRYLGALTSWNPLGHSGYVMGLLYLYL